MLMLREAGARKFNEVAEEGADFESNLLEERGYKTILDIPKGRLSDIELDQLDESLQDRSYFDLMYVRYLRKLPLDDWSVNLKKTLLSHEWKNLYQEGLFGGTREELEQLSDKEILKIFDSYRQHNFEYFLWHEQSNLSDKFKKRGEYLSNYYNINPTLPIYTDVYALEKNRRESTICKISNEFGAIYNSAGRIDKLFYLDRNLEKDIQNEKEEKGDISVGYLSWLLANLENFLKNGGLEDFLTYIQCRDSLPINLVKEFEERFDITIPQTLQKKHLNRDEFLEEADPFKKNIAEQLKRGEREIVNYLSKKLESLLAKKQNYIRKQFGGHTLERDTFSVLLDCVRSTKNRLRVTRKHFTICMYFYQRGDLPSELVKEFEEKFNIKIPSELQNLKTYDAYLFVPERVMEKFLSDFDHNIVEMAKWLDEKLLELLEKTKEKLVKPKEIMLNKLVKMNLVRKDLSQEELDGLRRNYQEMLSLPFRNEMEEKINIHLEDLSVREQLWLLKFLRDKSEKRVNNVIANSKKYGREFLRAFTACEFYKEAGESILYISQNLEKEAAQAIFAKYGNLVDASEKISDYLYTNFGHEKGFGDETVNNITENLLHKGKDLLIRFASQAEKAKRQGKGVDNEEILKHLENVKVEILLFASAFKAVSAEQKIDLEEIKEIELAITDSSELTEPTKAKMTDIFKENREHYPPQLLKETLKEFTEALNSTGKKFYILTHGQEIVSFMRFDELPNGNLYAGSLNVRPEIKGSAIGSAVLKAALDKEARELAIEAIVYEKNPMLKHYLKDFGFQMAGEIPNYHGTGEKFFKLERPASRLLKKAA